MKRIGIDHLLVIVHTIYMLFLIANGPTDWRGVEKDKEEKSYLPICWHTSPLWCAFVSTWCMPASMAHLKQSSPVPATLTTALIAWIHRISGMHALPRKGSSCHSVNWRSWKWENTHPEPFNSNTSMKFSSCRLTSSSGSAASAAYTAIISEVRVTAGCVTTLGSTAL